MEGQNTSGFLDKVLITRLTREFAVDLEKDSYFLGTRVLNPGVIDQILKVVKLVPNTTKLVAYHTEEKRAIGFLCLEENTSSLYSMKYIFVDPKFRKMGVATKLLNYTMLLAKEKGARKADINVYPASTQALDLYRTLGFREIGRFLVGTGYLSDFLLHRAIKRFFVGQGCPAKLAPGKETRLFKLQTTSRKNRETLFSIYKRCVDRMWTDFFEINANSLINGSRHVWQPSFFRDVLISDCADSFALVFNRPFFSDAAVELYNSSDSVIPFMLEDLLQILSQRGISYMQFTLFHPIDNATSNWFKEKGMHTFQYIVMGKTL